LAERLSPFLLVGQQNGQHLQDGGESTTPSSPFES
jgi:hypothetical protein